MSTLPFFLFLGLALSPKGYSQNTLSKVEFEVISIKPGDPAVGGRSVRVTPAGYRGQNVRLFELVMSAWRVNRDQIVGGPSWMQTAAWDIEAKFPAGASPAQTPEMMKAMLAERFHLITHTETRTLGVYALTVGKSGIKLSEASGDGGMSAGQNFIRYDSATIADLASQLSGYLGRQVIDRTGLTAKYAINLSFAPIDPDVSEDSASSIFQALQDQAGLKLESVKAPVKVLVVDRAEKPSSN